VLENMSANTRLILAVSLSIIFFVAYTAIFPPAKLSEEQNNTTAVQSLATTNQNTEGASVAQAGHNILSDERVVNKEATILSSIDSEHFSLKIDTLGRISSKILKDEKYYIDDKPIELIAQTGAQPLYIRFADDQLNEAALKTAYSSNVDKITLTESNSAQVILTQRLPDLTVTKTVTFYSNGQYDVAVQLSKPTRYFLYVGQHAEHKNQMMMALQGVMAYDRAEVANIFEDGDVEGRTTYRDVVLLSAFDQYFASIFYDFGSDTIVNIDRDRDDNPAAYLELDNSIEFKGYVGPKDYELLKSIEPELVNAIEFGWFTFAAKPLFIVLLWLHNLLGNWGWSIVVLVILLRIVLFPLTQKGMLSMAKLKDLAPKMKELREKHKGDPQRMNAATMELYRKHGANPFGGCLPMLLQIPVFFAVYRVLLNAVELQGAPWIFWIDDLSRMDPYFILPILMGASMYYQQKITPNNFTDPLQEKIFSYLPIIFTFFFITFPAGLVLYWFVNNLLSIAQQFVVNKQHGAAKLKVAEATQELSKKDK